jgi:hypothetical protein
MKDLQHVGPLFVQSSNWRIKSAYGLVCIIFNTFARLSHLIAFKSLCHDRKEPYLDQSFN